MLFFLYGEDTYRSRQKLNSIKQRFLDKDKSKMNLVELDGAKILFKDLKKELTAAPFLFDKKLVIIENLLTQNKQVKLFDEINDLIKSKKIPDFIFAIFWEGGKPDKRKNFFKTLSQEAQAEEFNLLDAGQINRWLIEEVKIRGGEINQAAINQLLIFVGNDLWQLSNELNKLLAYDKKISITNVNLLVEAKANDNIFQLMDAIAIKNKALALKLIKQQLEDFGSDAGYLLNMIVRQFRILLQVKSFVQENEELTVIPTSQKIAAALNIHPFVAQKTLAQAKNFDLEQLKNIYQKLLDIEYKIKTGRASAVELFDLFIAEI